ncbi:MAG: hypothetical protein HY554_00200, partial [Elusimicrobia bacterium]|nr:hypothetical protein [Elusimicrobiota bacterium]
MTAILAAALAWGALAAQGAGVCDLDQADRFFEARKYESALQVYEPGLAACQGEERRKALYRAAECKALLYRFAEAAQLVLAEKPSNDPVWEPWRLLLKAELARANLAQYGGAEPEDEEPGAGSGDVTRRTAAEWRADAQAAYLELWRRRKALLERPTREQGFFLDLKDADLDPAPTLWDFVVLRWTEQLLTSAPDPAAKPAAEAFLAEDFGTDFAAGDAPALQAAAVLEDAFRLPGPERAEARELWRLERLLIPFEHPQTVAGFADPAASRAKAIERLVRWKESFSRPRARAEAAFHAARLSQAAERYADAVALCRDAEDRWPGWPGTRRCKRLRAELELPRLELRGRFAPPLGAGLIGLKTRNLDRVYLRLYAVSEAELRRLWARRGRAEATDWSHLRSIDQESLASLLEGRPLHRWSVERKPKEPHRWVEGPADPPALAEGLYVAAACSNESCSPAGALVAGA